jgi:Pyridoxamine 5'-phosphate oxidase
MASWRDVEASEPEFAAAVRERFDAGVHKTLATVRRDGGPRISGIELRFAQGDVWFGSMPNAMKARDLRRDPRFQLHSPSADPPAWAGDAKLSGRAVEEDVSRMHELFDQAPSGPAHLFRAELDGVVLIHLNDARDKLVIDSWGEGREPKRIER